MCLSAPLASDVLCTTARARSNTSVFACLMLVQAGAWLQLFHQRVNVRLQRFDLHRVPLGILHFNVLPCCPAFHAATKQQAQRLHLRGAPLGPLRFASCSPIMHCQIFFNMAQLCVATLRAASRVGANRLCTAAKGRPLHLCLCRLDIVASWLLVAPLPSTWCALRQFPFCCQSGPALRKAILDCCAASRAAAKGRLQRFDLQRAPLGLLLVNVLPCCAAFCAAAKGQAHRFLLHCAPPGRLLFCVDAARSCLARLACAAFLSSCS